MSIKAVLLDLDDTLLEYPDSGGAFVKAYLGQMATFFREQLGILDIQETLVKSVRKIASSTDPLQFNGDIYWDAIGRVVEDEAALQNVRVALDRFYSENYPLLMGMSRPVKAAASLIESLGKRGYAVVIATNPFYPRTAIEQRLEWAGIDPKNPYIWRITHAENSHFAKPLPHYYTEIMAAIGFEPYEAIMVGDSWKNDIVPAAQTGMRTYWIRNNYTQPEGGITADADGSLAEFAYCVDQGWLDNLPAKEPTPIHVVPRLIGDVAALFSMTHEMPDHFWNQRPIPNEWTPLEIVCHLVEREQSVQRRQLEIIARKDNPFLTEPKPPLQAGEWECSLLKGEAVAREFARERAATIEFLEKLPAEAWNRPARHSIYGPTTLLEMAIITARHDLLHLQQLCQTIGKCE